MSKKEDNAIVQGKPLSVQFDVDDEQVVDQILTLVFHLGKKRGDRRLGAGTIAKEIVLRVIREYPDLLQEFFGDETSLAPDERVSRPAPHAEQTRPKARKRASGG